MQPLAVSQKITPCLTYSSEDLFGVKVPVPALKRGWLHGREIVQAWNVDRIAEKLGEGCWFSHYAPDHGDSDYSTPKVRPYALAGFWPSGGFIEVLMRRANPLEDFPRGTVGVYTDSAVRSEALMSELLTHYSHQQTIGVGRPRVGMLNASANGLTVERIPLSNEQEVPREQVDLFYGGGMSPWVESWIKTLTERRYGLSVLTGPPGTGKTTLIRSLAHWLGSTHVFYFIPAARFATIDSGEIVSFWAEENRNSPLRKILILEDAESVLLRRGDDNREKVATLLNLTDGMLGDALGLQVVCTLNSELTDLDPALLRPGRLIGHRHFDLLSAGQAKALASLFNKPIPEQERVSLAAIFNASPFPTSTPASPARREMGFHTKRASGDEAA